MGELVDDAARGEYERRAGPELEGDLGGERAVHAAALNAPRVARGAGSDGPGQTDDMEAY